MRRILLCVMVVMLGSASGLAGEVSHTFADAPAPHLEISPYAGSYLGANVDQGWLTGIRAYHHINRVWAWGAVYGYGQVSPDRRSSFGSGLRTRDVHLANAEVLINNDAVFRVGDAVVPMDFYLALGVGGLKLNAMWEPVGVLGGGIRVHTGCESLRIRIDVNSYLHNTQTTAGRRFDGDVSFFAGLSWMLSK